MQPKDASARGRKGPDLTSGPIGKTLITFALPVLGSNILQSLNGTANAFWVSHQLGEAALTATSNSNQIFFLMLGAVFGISMAANIMIGQAIGAEDRDLAKKVVGSCTAFFLALSLMVGVAGYLLTPGILDAMRTPADARIDAIAYLRVIFTAMPFMYFFSYVMMAMRGTGDSRTPFYFSLMSVVLDVILNPMLIIGVGPFPRLGIAGSAFSTLISQTVTLAAMLAYLYRSGSILVLRPAEFGLLVPDLKIIRTLILKGLPMGFQMIVISLAAVTMMSLVNLYGVHTSAAYGAAAQLWTYVQMPSMALGAAVSSMAAQNVGAGRIDRVEKVAHTGVLYAFLMTAAPVLVIYLTEGLVLRVFLPGSSPSLPIAVHINSFVLWGFIAFGMAFIFSGVVRATGAVWPPLLAMVISLWVVRIPFANLLMPAMGADAVWLSFPIGSLTTLVLAAGYYRWGGWRKARMLDVRPSSDAPDTGLGQPMIEESEAIIEAEEKALGEPSPVRS
ncbi:MATE family efflux transporter [Phenylobacterium soli]|uniref:MATE family efflux transporter n=1 Tax=Phenylobacterium soli TaxID=2170551 RepID=A0A328AG72_9CAUL|nr:MATE family efflux transporter [Phenylobacterium soli]RAK53752.1 MATE family efflux transporter [Phenylobacterium soli]